jgi:formylglycine-generating enzyme required for sulfatase activity
MDQIVHRVLRFDRFALDLTRGCLRTGDQNIDLRPKAFEVLHCLALNAGRLVHKQELYEAVWPNVTVSDDSLVQCIRELRHKLGDDDHRLIKTVSRRGYLLDATVSAQAPHTLSDGLAAKPPEEPQEIATKRGALHLWAVAAHQLHAWRAVAAGLTCVALGAIYLFGWPTSIANPGHVVEIAAGAPPHTIFRDCADCPEMVALAAGEFMMGSPEDEHGRQDVEGLPRRVVISRPFAIGKFEVTVDEFSTFVTETGMTVGNLCRVIVEHEGRTAVWGPPEASFRQPGFAVTGTQPVVCISWHEAQAYAAWLKRRTGKPYRLPTEAEWEYAARAGTKTKYSFGDDENALCAYAKFADLGSSLGWRGGCRSDIVAFGPLPVGTLKPNPWGIFDMHGNAWEWVEDCWTSVASEIPTDGSAFSRPGSCEVGVIRGGSWAAGTPRQRSATRFPAVTARHFQHFGFRVALTLGD